MLAQPALDIYLHDTYFIVAHFHLIMAMAGVFAIFAATYFWFPRMFGRTMNHRLGVLHFWITLFGAYAIFMLMHILGIAGNPRRYSELTGVQYLAALAPMHKFVTMAAIITISGQCLFLVNFFWSMFKGAPSEQNPWRCTTLEWRLSSPPQPGFGNELPVVHHGPYEYGNGDAPGPVTQEDFVMQDAPANP